MLPEQNMLVLFTCIRNQGLRGREQQRHERYRYVLVRNFFFIYYYYFFAFPFLGKNCAQILFVTELRHWRQINSFLFVLFKAFCQFLLISAIHKKWHWRVSPPSHAKLLVLKSSVIMSNVYQNKIEMRLTFSQFTSIFSDVKVTSLKR